MKLTKRESIRVCKKLWKEIEESGLSKQEFLDTPAGEKWRDKEYQNNCPLCEYDGKNECNKCPLHTQYGKGCHSLGFMETEPISPEWFEAVRGLKE